MAGEHQNTLYYGDNLKVLDQYIASESVDLIYLDPPFNSNASYNMLFKAPDGSDSDAQINAFDDTWSWGTSAEEAVAWVRDSGHHKTSDLLETMRGFLGENDMMAYLAMMAARLIELHRVLKPTGSLYLHCDPTASHYLKLLLDGVFGPTNFRSEIIWRRTGSHNKASRWGPIHDTIFYFTKSDLRTWNNPVRPYMLGHVEEHFIANEDGTFKTGYYGNVLTGSGTRNGESGKPWQGFDPTAKGRHWAIPGKLWDESGLDATGLSQHEKLDLLLEQGLIKITPDHAWPVYERTVQKGEGPAAPDIWAYQPYTEGTVFGIDEGIDEDVRWLSPRDAERLGYPTQKPLALLERIIAASSNDGDVVLDPFCGCGTALDAAEKLGRKWIGIDVTHLAINLIEQRMVDAHPDAGFKVVGRPESLSGAEELAKRDKHEFEKWIVPKLEGHLFEGGRKGADGGIDGFIYFRPDPASRKTEKAILSVKGGDNVGVGMIRDLHSTMEREKALAGVFITKALPTKPMITEAAKVGLFEGPGGRNIPRLQIVTLAEIFAGKRPDLPHIDSPYKKAQRSKKASGQGTLL